MSGVTARELTRVEAARSGGCGAAARKAEHAARLDSTSSERVSCIGALGRFWEASRCCDVLLYRLQSDLEPQRADVRLLCW